MEVQSLSQLPAQLEVFSIDKAECSLDFGQGSSACFVSVLGVEGETSAPIA